jgi:hypothetical protein
MRTGETPSHCGGYRTGEKMEAKAHDGGNVGWRKTGHIGLRNLRDGRKYEKEEEG